MACRVPRKTTKQPEQWGNIQQAAGIENLKRPTWTLCKVITIYYVCGGSWCKVMYRSVREHQVHLVVEVEANPLMVLLAWYEEIA